MNINYYDRKMVEIGDSMSMAWSHNEEYIMANKEWLFDITNDQKEVIEFSIELFKERFEKNHDDLVFKSIEFEPFWNGEEDVFTATIKFELFED